MLGRTCDIINSFFHLKKKKITTFITVNEIIFRKIFSCDTYTVLTLTQKTIFQSQSEKYCFYFFSKAKFSVVFFNVHFVDVVKKSVLNVHCWFEKKCNYTC